MTDKSPGMIKVVTKTTTLQMFYVDDIASPGAIGYHAASNCFRIMHKNGLSLIPVNELVRLDLKRSTTAEG